MTTQVFGCGPDRDCTGHDRAGIFNKSAVQALDGTYPTGRYDAYGYREMSTMTAGANGGHLYGISSEPTFDATGYSDTEAWSIYADFSLKAGHIKQAYLALLDEPLIASGASVGELYGLYIQPMTDGQTVNRAIHTCGGDHYFHDNATFGHDVKVTGKFGCNGKDPQGTYPSGGALASYKSGPYGFDSPNMAADLYNLVINFRRALVNNGIFSA